MVLGAMEKLNQWLTLIANLGVLAGLILLVYELKQGRDLATFEAVQSGRDHRVEQFRELRDSDYYAPIVTKLRKGQKLSQEESARWNAHIAMEWAITYSEWVKMDLGLSGKYQILNRSAPLIALTIPGSTEWWVSVGSKLYPAEFVSFIEEKR